MFVVQMEFIVLPPACNFYVATAHCQNRSNLILSESFQEGILTEICIQKLRKWAIFVHSLRCIDLNNWNAKHA